MQSSGRRGLSGEVLFVVYLTRLSVVPVASNSRMTGK
jgi:hypothetical protein